MTKITLTIPVEKRGEKKLDNRMDKSSLLNRHTISIFQLRLVA